MLVDQEYYAQTFMGQPVPEAVWPRYERAAEEAVNSLCHGFFDAHGLADLQLVTDQTRVKNAICAQIEFYQDQGGVTTNERAAAQEGAKSFTLGSFSMTAPTGAAASVEWTGAVDDRVVRYLQPTGLLYGGVHQYG
ncbi:hypothetical protein [Lacticaseibacillus parakribbianus]|uniref:hypothetical protein n=1 Tax=Lacticaseibacillus parakribbianus TaxID=2970927 RepID=UPI0021CAE6CF|nr:hypothetical protein [Lacticaseibacillus parakribbianus]